jgi:hypothetical protein
MKAGPGDSDKIRLPELPVFKRFSLALRQEYATADEILSVIDRTVSRIKDVLDREAEIRRRADAEEFPDEVAFEDEESELFPEEMVEPEELEDLLEPEREPQSELQPQSPPEEDRGELFVESPESVAEDQKFQEQSLTADEEIESLLSEPDVDAIFPLEEEGVDALIREEEEVTTLIRPDSDEPVGRTSKTKSTAKRKPKKKPPQPDIVRVSKHGKPLGLSKVKKNVKKSTKRPAKAAKRKGTPKGRSRSR